jgi:ABC-2 type transport system ATP-binding protein
LSTANDVIVVQGLTKKFGDFTAVDNISFTVKQGEIFGILGPNGAGKTTTLECIEGLQTPTSGSTAILGFDTQKSAKDVKERIGVQLQASAYFENLTLKEILELFGGFYRRHLPPQDLLAKVDLTDKMNQTVAKLSGGQKQRFAIAATLVNDPELVFLDEPTTGLDPQARRHLWDFIESIHKEGRTVVLTTHYMEEAEFLCQRVAIMDQAHIVALDTPEKLIQTLPNPFHIRVAFSVQPPEDGLAALEAVNEVQREDGAFILRSSNAARTLPALLAWTGKGGTQIERLEVQPANLEEVFLAYTGRALRE